MAKTRLRALEDTEPGPATLTIEQLAAQTAMTVRNIRSHRARGLLPAPAVRDRIGYYGPEHVSRLELVRELQAEGFNLEAIKRLLEETHGGSEQLLSLRRALAQPFATEEPQVFTLEELAARFGADVGPEALVKAEKLGVLIPLGEERYEAPSPLLIDVAEEVVQRGVTLDHALAVVGKVGERCESVARAFVKLFLDDVWKPFAAASYPDEQWPEVVEAIDRLRPISSQALLAVYQLTMGREVDRAFGKELERLSRRRR